MDLIAHRGLINNKYNENTLGAFKNAINNGYKGIELDIRKTKDNKIVVIHDKFIDRTSNGTGLVSDYTYKQLLKYNFGTKTTFSKIPLLENVIKNISNTIIFIELKELIEENELKSILSKNKTNTYYLMSFNRKYIDNIFNIGYKLGIINNIFNSFIDINKYDFVVILKSLFNKDIYDYCVNSNIEVVLYYLIKTNINNDSVYKYDLKYIC